MSIWSSNLSIQFWLDTADPAGYPGISDGPLKWAYATKEEAIAGLTTLLSLNEVYNFGSLATFVPTAGLTIAPEEQIFPPSEDWDSAQELYVVRATGREVDGASFDFDVAWTVFEIPDSYNYTTSEADYNTVMSPYEPFGESGTTYIYMPNVATGESIIDDPRNGDFLPKDNSYDQSWTGAEHNTTGYFPILPVSVSSELQLRLDNDGHWYPNLTEPTKWQPDVSIVIVAFADNTRWAVLRPHKDGGFMLYESPSATNKTKAISLIRIFRYDRTLSKIVEPELLDSYLPK